MCCFRTILLKWRVGMILLGTSSLKSLPTKGWPNMLNPVCVQDASLSLSESYGLHGYIKSYSFNVSSSSYCLISATLVRQLDSFYGLQKQRGISRGQCILPKISVLRKKKDETSSRNSHFSTLTLALEVWLDKSMRGISVTLSSLENSTIFDIKSVSQLQAMTGWWYTLIFNRFPSMLWNNHLIKLSGAVWTLVI